MKIHFFNIFILQPTHKDVSLKQFYFTAYFFPKPKKWIKVKKKSPTVWSKCILNFSTFTITIKIIFFLHLCFSQAQEVLGTNVSVYQKFSSTLSCWFDLIQATSSSTINATKKLTRSLQPRREMLRWIQFQIFCGKFYGFKFYKNA